MSVPLTQALDYMVNFLRWLAIVPACIFAWYLAIFVGLSMLTTVEEFCPGAVVGSGQCTAVWYPSAERAVICLGVALAAFLLVAVASAIAPTHRIIVSRVALGIGTVAAAFIAIRTNAYLALASAISAGFLTTLAVASIEGRNARKTPIGKSSIVLGLGLVMAAAFGIFTQYPEPFAMPESFSWIFAFLTTLLTYAWFRFDAVEIAYRPALWLHFLVFALGQLILPAYFIKSRGWRAGLVAFLWQLAFVAFCLGAVGIAAAAVAAHRLDVFGDIWHWAISSSRWH